VGEGGQDLQGLSARRIGRIGPKEAQLMEGVDVPGEGPVMGAFALDLEPSCYRRDLLRQDRVEPEG
jgi:hypothetical protein